MTADDIRRGDRVTITITATVAQVTDRLIHLDHDGQYLGGVMRRRIADDGPVSLVRHVPAEPDGADQ